MNPIKYKHGRRTITNDIAYIAGFVDGEGCIRLKRANQGGNSYYVTLQITNSNEDILEFIRQLFGGQIGFQEKASNKVIYQYRLTSAEAVGALKLLYPFLREKRTQAHMAILFQENKDKLTPEAKYRLFSDLMEIKKRPEVIGNIYENPKGFWGQDEHEEMPKEFRETQK